MSRWTASSTRCWPRSRRRGSSSAPRHWPTRRPPPSTPGPRRAAPPPTARTPRPRSNWPASSSSTAPPASAPKRSRPSSRGRAALSSCVRRCGRVPTTSDLLSQPPMTPDGTAELERLWREAAPRVLAALVRRYGDFDSAEDALQEALLAASRQWPDEGVPRDPTSWLLTVASRRLVDQWRADSARAERERLL